ncbi:hypothetical protein KTO58_02275 [Chitinophaga pendula]|uniref:hypothetical protein n=1 Tax=Chitinophaga TaxID=79328 RepID=UPI000BAF6183|nr:MULTISPECIES: hypothetical protein [Chitinophaga]ASZ14324.1 hypothetical protein CK934_26940 [Chitinophaga sp. MD30]UCJ08027.1 hypothetical protein KTO58_02275 [Chitinophaga pendula]
MAAQTPYNEHDHNETPLHHSLEQVRHNEVQEIMGKMPSWIVRRGISGIGILVLLVLAGAYYFHYPDILTSQVTITRQPQAARYSATGTIAGQRSGLVIPGQQVQIKLSAYPYTEYGMLKGIVKSCAPSPTDSTFLLDIQLPQGLYTTAGKTLPNQGMLNGNAEIFLEDKNMLLRLFERIYK